MKIVFIAVVLLFVLVASFVPQIINFIYPKEGWGFTNTTFKESELLGFYGSFLSFVGTVLLGIFALWQNIIIRKQAEKENDELRGLNKQANSINERLLRIEEERQMPCIDFCDYKNLVLRNATEDIFFNFCKSSINEGVRVYFIAQNISNIYIANFSIKELRIVKLQGQKDVDIPNVDGILYQPFDFELEKDSYKHEFGTFLIQNEEKYLIITLPKNLFDSIDDSFFYFIVKIEITTHTKSKFFEPLKFLCYFVLENNKISARIVDKSLSVERLVE